MADRQPSYPESATQGGGRDGPTGDAADGSGDGQAGEGVAALRATLDEHGDALAAAVEATDDLDDLLATAMLIVATADEDEVEQLTDSTANLLRAADGVSTAAAADLAETVGEDARDLGTALETVLAFQREGHLDDLVDLAAAFSASLSAAEVEALATTLEENGDDLVDALDVVLELHREDRLADLVELASVLSTLDVDEDTATGLNRLLGALGEAERTAEPASLLGTLRGLRTRDARAGLGYLLALLRAQGRRLRER
jgi:uncharacterized protein YjgD (DUF1641 family)